MNFRSHNSILKFANCLIRILEIIFPKSIDILRQETSTTDGPKPILIEYPEEVIRIFNLKLKKDENG